MSMPGFGELAIIFAIVMVIFGAGKIPSIARDLGSSFHEFRKAMNGEESAKKKSKK